MARNELDASVNLLASDQGLERSISAGLKGLEEMVKVATRLNSALGEASKNLSKVRALGNIQSLAAPGERAVVGTQRTTNTIVQANEIARALQTVGNGNTPSQLLRGTLARREQILPELTGQARVQGAAQISAARELQKELDSVNKAALQAERSLAKLVGPVSAQTQASYERLKTDIDQINTRLSGNIQRGRFNSNDALLEQLRSKVSELGVLPAAESAARKTALAEEAASWRNLGKAVEYAATQQIKAQIAGEKSSSRILQKDLESLAAAAVRTKKALADLEAPLPPATLASYKELETEIARLNDRIKLNTERGRVSPADNNGLVEQLRARTSELTALVPKTKAALAEEEQGWNRIGRAIEYAATQTERQNRATIKAAKEASPEGQQLAAARTRQNVNNNLFGDGGVNFAGRIAQSYGLFQAVNAAYGAVFGALGVLKDFDAELANLKGIAAATGPEMEALSKTILDVSVNSRFGIVDLAKAATTLAQAGFSTTEISSSLQGFAKLATASGSTLEQSVDVGTAALGSFQLQASDTAHVADVMTAALNLTKLTMDKLGQGIQYVGTTGYELNLSLEETTALLGGLSNSGIRSGSTLGTGLRQFLIGIQEPTEKLRKIMDRLGLTMDDINIKTNGVTGVIANLTKAGFSSQDAFKGLETRAAAAFLALKNQLPLVQSLEHAFVLQGAATQAAAAQMDSFASQGSQTLNNLSAIAVKATEPLTRALTAGLGGLNSVLKDVNSGSGTAIAVAGLATLGVVAAAATGGIASLVRGFLGARAATASLAASQAELAIASKVASGAMTEEAAAAARLALVEGEASVATGVLGTAMKFLGGPWGILIGLAVSLVPLLLQYSDASAKAAQRTEELQTAANAVKGKLDGYDSTITSVEHELDRLSQRSKQLRGDKAALANEVLSLTNRFEGLGAMLGSTNVKYETLIGTLRRYLSLQRDKRAAEFIEATGVSDQQIANSQGIIKDLQSKYREATRTQVFAGSSGGYSSSLTLARTPAEKTAADIISGRIPLVPDGQTPGRGQLGTLQLADTVRDLSKNLGDNSTVLTDLRAFLAARASLTANAAENDNRKQLYIRDQLLGSKNVGLIEDRLNSIRANVSDQSLGRPQAVGQLQGLVGNLDKDIKNPRNGSIGAQAALSHIRQEVNDYLQELLGRAATETEEAAKKAKEAARADRARRAEILVPRESDSELKALEAEAKLPKSYDAYRKELPELQAAVDRFVAAKVQQAGVELDKKGVSRTSADGQRYIGEAKKDAEARAKTFWVNIGTAVNAGTTKLQDNAIAAIKNNELAATTETRQKAALLQGNLEALNKPENALRAGAYQKEFVQNQIDKLKEVEDKAALLAKIAEIEQLLHQLDDAQRRALDGNATIATNARTEVEKLKKDIDAALVEKSKLEGYDTSALPTTFSANFTRAASVWRKNNDSALTFSETINKNLGGAFQSASDAGESFFTGIIGGSQNVLSSFGSFAKSMAQILDQLVAKFLVTKLFDFALSFLGKSSGDSYTAPSDGSSYTSSDYGFFNGGRVPAVQHFAVGGRVVGGSRIKDSVRALLAGDEYVVRSKAVDAVGVDFMNDLNRRGPEAIADRAGVRGVPVAGGGSTAHIYVVLPEEKPQMGPKDVLATVHRDMLDGGVTKKLIQSITL